MTAEARQWRNTLRWSTNSNFFQTFGQQWAYPQETSVATWYRILPHLQLSLFTMTSSPRKFAECLYCNVTPRSHLTCFCLVSSSSSAICNYTVVQSSTVHTVIQITFIHTFIQLCIHTLIPSHINAYTTYTWYQFLNGCISHPNLVSAISLQISLYLSSCHAPSSNKRTACNHHFHQKCHPQCVWSRDVTNQSFQVVSPKRGTTRIYVLSCFERAVLNRQLEFYLVSSGQS